MKDERDLYNQRGPQGTENAGATGSAPAKSETDEGTKTGELERVDEGTVETAVGFSPFRAWANRQIDRRPGGFTLHYQEKTQAVTEITPDGQLRLELEGAATLIPFDEPYIRAILSQLLT